MFWFNPRAEYERCSLSFLGAALVTMALAVFAGLHDLLDEAVLLGRQADVPSWHVGLAAIGSEYYPWQRLPIACGGER